MRFRFFMLSALGSLLVPAGSALAHIDLDSPTDRGCIDQKTGPCGSSCDPARSNVTLLEPGSTVTVRWTETVNHTGHYRISFDDDGDDAFQNPTSYDDIQQNPTLPVLLDGIQDMSGGQYEAQVTLPNIECENCTLQLIQVMTDKAPCCDGNDFYYRCADLSLRVVGGGGDAGPDPMVDAGPDPAVDAGPGGGGGNDSGCGCGAEDEGSPGTILLMLAVGLCLRRSPLRPRA